MAQNLPDIPLVMVERFGKAFAAFVAEVEKAVNEGMMDPAYSSSPYFLVWQTQALPRLKEENAAIQNAVARFQIGEEKTIANLAQEQLHLAKHLDGFRLDFAGPQYAQTLDKLETAVVVAASELSRKLPF